MSKEYYEKNKEKLLVKARENYLKNRDIRLEQAKHYRNTNKVKTLQYASEYNKKNKDKKKEYNRRYQQENKGKLKEYRKDNLVEYRKEYNKQYFEENKDVLITQKKAYYQENKDRILQKSRDANEKNRYKISVHNKLYTEKNKIVLKMKTAMRLNQWVEYLKNKHGDIPYCQVCSKELKWPIYGKSDKKIIVHFDHRNGGQEKISRDPGSWLRSRPHNEKNIGIWDECNLGILCGDCNKNLPTKNREEWIVKASEYVFKNMEVKI